MLVFVSCLVTHSLTYLLTYVPTQGKIEVSLGMYEKAAQIRRTLQAPQPCELYIS